MTNVIRPEGPQPIPAHANKVFEGILFDVYQWEQELYDGSRTTFEKLRRPDTVVVFPVLEDGRILLTKQEQPGKTPFVGGAGGRLEPGEDALSGAKREMLEETGYEAERFTLWKAVQPSSKVDWALFFFVAHGCKQVAEPAPDAGEKIEALLVSFDEFIVIATGESEHGHFSEVEITPELYQARLHPEKMQALRQIFEIPYKDPNTFK